MGDVFVDVLPNDTHTEAIEAMAEAGIITGFADGRFRPADQVTRGQMASLLFRTVEIPEGSQSFPDTAGTTHAEAISALASAGIIGGFPDGTFRPTAPITRGQMATMISKTFDLPSTGRSFFSDVANTPHQVGINALAAAGITTGYADGTFRPDQNTPRGQTAAFLYRTVHSAEPEPSAGWTVTNVVDGDTLDVTSSSGVQERIRIIGIDTPERGDCGFDEATEFLTEIALGQEVTLVPGARDDRDAYGRLLRYVDMNEFDLGAEQIASGVAIARYDSRDGYGAHPRELEYIAIDEVTPDLCPTA